MILILGWSLGFPGELFEHKDSRTHQDPWNQNLHGGPRDLSLEVPRMTDDEPARLGNGEQLVYLR